MVFGVGDGKGQRRGGCLPGRLDFFAVWVIFAKAIVKESSRAFAR